MKGLILFLIYFSLGFCIVAQSFSQGKEKDSTNQDAGAKNVLTKNTPEDKVFILRKFNFIRNAITTFSYLTSDTSMEFQMQSKRKISLFLTPEELQEMRPQGVDPLGEELLRRYRDVSPVLPISPLISQGIKGSVENLESSNKKLLGPNLPIPKDIEIDILKILWGQKASTASEIYAQMNSLWPITSENLRQILEEMVARGFLARKKISPSNKFSFFDLVQIEMSSKNRNNKIYLYWPLIAKEKLITFLETQRYLAFTSSETPSSNGGKSIYQKTLEDKLYRLIQ